MTNNGSMIAPWGSGPSGQYTAADRARVAQFGVGTQAVHPAGQREDYVSEEAYQADLRRVEAALQGQQSFYDEQNAIWDAEARAREVNQDGFSAEARPHPYRHGVDPPMPNRSSEWDGYQWVPYKFDEAPSGLVDGVLPWNPAFGPAPWAESTALVPAAPRSFWLDYAARLRRDPWTFIGLGASLAARVMLPGIGWVSLVPMAGALLYELSDEAGKAGRAVPSQTPTPAFADYNAHTNWPTSGVVDPPMRLQQLSKATYEESSR